MAEVLISPDSEAAAVSLLRAGLGSLATKVSTTVPSTMPVAMVRVSQTGGARFDMSFESAQLTVECWAADGVTASNLARRAEALMFAAAATDVAGVFVRRVDSVGGVQSFPDPDTNKPRYTFTVRWLVRPATL